MTEHEQQAGVMKIQFQYNERPVQQTFNYSSSSELTTKHYDARYGNIQPKGTYFNYYSSPQPFMLLFTFILTITLQAVLLKSVFMGVHFYVGLALCAYILYLLLFLGFSDPGIAFLYYQKLQKHLDLQICTERCSHKMTLAQQFGYYCNKCNCYTTKDTRHCNICECCIVNHDHHCVFIGKCVGRNNFDHFKHFLCFIFSTLIYGLVSALYSINQISTLSNNQNG